MSIKADSYARDQIIILLAERPDYAPELARRLRKRGVFLGHGIYPLLRDMECSGSLVSEERNENLAERGGRPRVYYQLAHVPTQSDAQRSGK